MKKLILLLCISAFALTGCNPSVDNPQPIEVRTLGKSYKESVAVVMPDTANVVSKDLVQWTKGVYSINVQGLGGVIDTLTYKRSSGGSLSSEDINRILNTEVSNTVWEKKDSGDNSIFYKTKGYVAIYNTTEEALIIMVARSPKP